MHVAAIAATCWILLLNALVGFQLLDDGTPMSLSLICISAAVLFIGTGYIALDTGFNWTGHFEPSHFGDNRNIGLYVLYQLFPLVCLVVFFVLEAILVLSVLGEFRPMSMCGPPCKGEFALLTVHTLVFLTAAGLLFAIGQVFQYVVSTYVCHGTHGKINGTLFETLFTLLSVGTLWVFWSSITEDDWPLPVGGGYN